MKSLCVVHLVRHLNGVAALQRFLRSYEQFPAGVDHDLAFLFKGFPGNRVPQEYEEVLARFPHAKVFVPDAGYDITAYFAAARSLPHEYLCFLNSFSSILASDWLLKLYAPAQNEAVGAVAATGSYQSIYSDLFSAEYRNLHYPPYKKLLLTYFPFLRLFRNKLRRPLYKRLFAAFPNYHIRTNAFLLRRELMNTLTPPRIRRKFDAYLFESGKQGFTKQIQAKGKSVLIVGRNGHAYALQDWHLSNIFWQADQENLLIGDNQTNHYQNGTMEARREYAIHAWGPDARPATPAPAGNDAAAITADSPAVRKAVDA